jgi:chromosome segregation ATPase
MLRLWLTELKITKEFEELERRRKELERERKELERWREKERMRIEEAYEKQEDLRRESEVWSVSQAFLLCF